MDQRFRDIYQAFDTSPLRPEQAELHVALDSLRENASGIVVTLARKIQLAQSGKSAQVVAGHRGSGKSTELYRLQRELEQPSTGGQKFFVIFCATKLDLDLNDVDFMDVLVAIIRQAAQQLLQRLKVTLRPGYFRDRWERLKSILFSDVELEGIELEAGFMKLSTAIKSSPDARQQIRKLFEPDAGNWLAAANDVLGQAVAAVTKQGYGGIVIIVDDLDKMIFRPQDRMGCTTAEYLFVHRAAQLTALNCHVVYSIPIELAYSHQQQNIELAYGGSVPVISMTKVTERPPQAGLYQPGVGKFREVISKRLSSAGANARDLFAEDDLQAEIIRLSGGQPTELMTLIRECMVAKDLPITRDSLRHAEVNGRRDYERQLRVEHWAVLEQVRRDGRLHRSAANDAIVRELLDGRAILQYVNDDVWYGLNPYVAGLTPPPLPPPPAAPATP